MPRQKVASKLKSLRLPLWAPTLLLIAAGVLGLVLSLGSGNVGILYLLLFAAGAIIGTLFVKPQGLVVAVSQVPLMFAIVTPIIAWLLNSLVDPSKGGATDSTPTKTRLITAAYPVVQYFPWMLGILGVCVVIAIWRYFELTRINSKQQITERKEAKRRQEQSKKSNESATLARRRMAESDERLSGQRRQGVRRHGVRHATDQMRPASDIIRDAEKRRLERAERFARNRQEASRRLEERQQRRPATRPENTNVAPPKQEPESLVIRSERETRQPLPRQSAPSQQAARPQAPGATKPAKSQPVKPQQRLWGDSAASSGAGAQRREAPRRPRPIPQDETRQTRRLQEPSREFPRDRGSIRRVDERRGNYSEEWPPRRERPRRTMRQDPRD